MESFKLNSGLSILVPCFNEAGNIEATFARIANVLQEIQYEVIFIDDGSTDETRKEILRVHQVQPTEVKLLSHDINMGIPYAWKTGLSAARFETICLIDGDLQNPPEAINHLLKVLAEQQSDVVQATRSSIGRIRDQRLILSRGLNWILNVAFGQQARDSKSGFIISNKEALQDVFQDISKFRHFQTFIGVALRARGYRVVETETLFMSREVGESFLTKGRIVEVLMSTAKDILIGLKLYGRSKRYDQIPGRITTSPLDISLFRKVRFHVFFATMPLHKWII